MDILYGKSGKSILFNSKNWNAVGGCNEAPFLLYMLAKRFPQHNFYICGNNDYYETFQGRSLLPNIINLWDPKFFDKVSPFIYIREQYDSSGPDSAEKLQHRMNYWKYTVNTIKKLNIKPKLMIDIVGIIYGNSFYEVKPNGKKPGSYCRCLIQCERYNSHMTFLKNTLSELGCEELAYIMTDPRQINWDFTLVNQPNKILSQINMIYKFFNSENGYSTNYFPRDKGYKVKKEYNMVYAGVETMTLLSKTPNYNMDLSNKKGFNIILNAGVITSKTVKPRRYFQLEDWVLSDKNFDCSIYGEWPSEIVKSDKRFKGALHPNKLHTVLDTTKYTLCIPIEASWVTAKFCEMAHFGVLPFVTPEYATGIECYIPKFCYVENRDELYSKIQLLESNYDMYISVMHEIFSNIEKLGAYNGDYIINYFNKFLNFKFENPISYSKSIHELYLEDYEEAFTNKSKNPIINLFS